MKLIDYCEAKVPTWALSYLVNGDASGLEDDEIKMCDEWWRECSEALPPDCSLSFDYSGEEHFTWTPAFGLACTVEDCALLAFAPNDDAREGIELPDWLENRALA